MHDEPVADLSKNELAAQKSDDTVICPMCGAIAVQEKCKVICRSDICRGRVVMNCSEF